MSQIACPKCGKVLNVSPHLAGKRVGCPYCKAGIAVPAARPRPPASPENALAELLDSGPATPAMKPQSRRPAKGAAASLLKRRATSDVNNVLAAGIALVATVVVCVALLPAQGTYLADLVLARGWVPYAVVFLASWSFAVLGLKLKKLARQRQALLLDLLPEELGADIRADEVPKYVEHIAAQPIGPDESYLVNRVVRGLEHFQVRNSAPEVASILASQSEIDATTVVSSYTMVKVFIWAMPILGFIGTVIGISMAVVGLGGSVSTAESVSEMTSALMPVLGGLATAFDTTLIALVLSLIVKFPAASLQKREEDLLTGIDEYCNEHLLKRLADDRNEASGPPLNTAALEAWTRRLEMLGAKLTRQVADGWEEITARLQAVEQQRLGRIQEGDVALAKASEALHKSVDSLGRSVEYLNAGLVTLNKVLTRLGEQPVALPEPPRRRRWALWRSNGT